MTTENQTQDRKIKIFAFNNGGSENCLQAVAIGEDGRVVAYHICSDESFMRGDLGVDGDWSGKHKLYDEAYGVGNWTIEWVDDPSNHFGLKQALKKGAPQ